MSSDLETFVRQLTYRPDERVKLFRSLPLPLRAVALEQLSTHITQTLLRQLRIKEIVEILDHLDMRQAERVLTCVGDAKRRERIVAQLKGDIKEKLEYFLRFHPQATLSLITFNYLLLSHTTSIADAAKAIDEHYTETGKFPDLLVHADGTLIGEVTLPTLVRERNTALLKRFIVPVCTITYQAEVREIIDTLTSSDERKVVVLDHDESVLGVIYADAARSLFATLPADSLYDFAGVGTSEKPFDGVLTKVRNRYQWLILNLGTSFLAGSVVLSFQDTLDTLTILAVYIPILAGMGGNAATQTLAVMVRGLTLGTISLQNAWPAIKNEMLAGVINGLIIGAIVSVVTTVWNGNPLLGLVVALSLIGAHIVAATAGAIVPLVMKQLGKDPAATSVIFITTCTDVLGIFFLLGLATLLLV